MRMGSPATVSLAIITVLAVLVAPVCAPLCAARICSAAPSQGQCHDMAGMPDGDGERIAALGKTCGNFEFSAVLVKADEQSLSSQSVRTDAPAVLIVSSHRKSVAQPSPSIGRCGEHRVPLEPASSFLLAMILRI